MPGLHLTADLYNCRCEPHWLRDAGALGDWCLQAARRAGLEPVNQLFHEFADTGAASVTLLLTDQTRVHVQTCPRQKAVALDVQAAFEGDSHPAPARALMQALVDRFAPEWTEQRSLDRGEAA